MSRGRMILIGIDSALVGLGVITSFAGAEDVIGRTTMAILLLVYVGVSASVRAFEAALHIAPPGYELVPVQPQQIVDTPTEALPLVRR